MRRVTSHRLPGLFVEGVAAVPAAVLLHLDAFAIVGAVLHRDVVPSLADLARQRHLHSLVARHGAPLLDDLGDAAGADRTTTLPDREAEAFLHRDRRDELDGHLGVLARLHHLDAFRPPRRAASV